MNDPQYMCELYDKLHASPLQAKFRQLAPMPVGVVFVQRPGMTDEQIRWHFRTMKSHGYNCLKGLYPIATDSLARLQNMALDEGIIPWWYGEAAFEPIDDKLCSELGIAPGTPVPQVRADPRYQQRQWQRMRRRVSDEATGDPIDPQHRPKVPFTFDHEIGPESAQWFTQWLQKQYGTVQALQLAWNMDRAMVTRPASAWKNWSDVERDVIRMVKEGTREYRRLRDVLRFKADVYLDMVREQANRFAERSPGVPTRAGGEMGLFLPFASRATDMEGVADAMMNTGSFYPSIHLAWHFEEVAFEVARPIYMQASLVVDWFKGGWTAPWESTGGPQQFSGGRAHLYPRMSDHQAGFTVDAGTMTQLMLSYLAAGCRGVGLWCWNARSFGWEAGEYALLDRQEQPCPRTVAAGQIGAAMQRWRDELWAARKQPQVGIYGDWDSDAMYAAIAVMGREFFKHMPIEARIGAARALINANVPFEHVSATDLRAGLADRYAAIYLPSIVAISDDMLSLLADYVQRGGRVVLDLPGAWFDEFGRLRMGDRGSAFERLFGVLVRDMQFSSRFRPRQIRDQLLEGFVADLEPTTAEVVERYGDGSVCVTRNRAGGGEAILLGCEAARLCHKPGNVLMEALLKRYACGNQTPAYACSGAIVYRLASPGVDHFFLINDGDSCRVALEVAPHRYAQWRDALTDEPVEVDDVAIDAHSGRWLRALHAPEVTR